MRSIRELAKLLEMKHALICSALAALLAVHGGMAGRLAGHGLICLLCLAALWRAELGLVSVFPALYMLLPTPQSVGLREILYAALIGCTFLRAAVDGKDWVAALLTGRTAWFIIVAVTLLFVNFFVAMSEAVPLKDWARGVLPFLFIGFGLPVAAVLRGRPDARRHLVASIAVTALLFSFHVVQVYLGNRLWERHWFAYHEGEWTRILPEQVSSYDSSLVGRFAKRITLELQQSTDALVPLGIIWGTIGFVFGVKRRLRVLSLALAQTAIVAVLVTCTRSMLLSAGAVLAGLAFACLWLGRIKVVRCLTALTVAAVTVAAVIAVFGLRDIYVNRFTQLVSASRASLARVGINRASLARVGINRASLARVGINLEGIPDLQDDNVTARQEELLIAWKLFRASPWLGQGFGVKHPMRFATGFGHVVEQHVAYVHNWPIYFLMVGGVPFLIFYVWTACGPLLSVLKRGSEWDAECRVAIACTVALLLTYGLIFAVFRLISFNLLLGSMWGVVLSREITREDDKACAA